MKKRVLKVRHPIDMSFIEFQLHFIQQVSKTIIMSKKVINQPKSFHHDQTVAFFVFIYPTFNILCPFLPAISCET